MKTTVTPTSKQNARNTSVAHCSPQDLRCSPPGLPVAIFVAALGALYLGSFAGLQAQSAGDSGTGVVDPGFGFDNDWDSDDGSGSPFDGEGGDGGDAGDPPADDDPVPAPAPTPPPPPLPPEDDGIHAIYRWLGAGIGPAEWNDPDNWYPRGVPDASDTAVIARIGQQCPVIADRIEVGTLLFDDSLEVDFTISANSIYIDTGLQIHWNYVQALHHRIQVRDDFFMMEFDPDGNPTSYFSYHDNYGTSARLDSNYLGSTLELLLEVDPDSSDFSGELWQQEAHYWDFSAGVVDEVGDVEASTSTAAGADVWLTQVPGWGSVLDFSSDNGAAVQFPQGLADGSRFTDYSLSFWFQLTSLKDQVILDMGCDHSGSQDSSYDAGGLSVLIDDGKLRVVANADTSERNVVYPPVRFEVALPANASLEVGPWYMATIVFEGEGGANGAGSLELFLDHDQRGYDSSGKDLNSLHAHIYTKRALVVDQNWSIGARSGPYAEPYDGFTPNAFSGLLDGLALYPGLSLTPVAVADLYDATLASLRHEWSFSQNLEDSAPRTAVSPAWQLSVRNSGDPAYDTEDRIDTSAAIALGDGQVLDISSVAVEPQQFEQYENYQDYSLSLWFKPERTSGSQLLFDAGDRTNGFALRVQDGMLEAASVAQALGRGAERLSVGPVIPGQWHLATLVNDTHAGTLTLSLDDFRAVDWLDYQDTVAPDQPWLLAAGGQTWAIGGPSRQTSDTAFDSDSSSDPGGPFTGRLDRVRVHHRALSMEAIEKEFYSYLNARPAHRFVPWDNDGNALPHQVAMRDEIAAVRGDQWQLPHSSFTEPSLQVEGDALRFDSGYYVKINEQTGVANDLHERMDAFTVNIWFKPPAWLSGLQYLYQQGAAEEGITLRLNAGQLEGGICGFGGGEIQVRSTVANAEHGQVEADEWQLATLSFDGLSGELMLYLNSELIAVSETDLDAVNPGADSAAPYYAAIGAPFIQSLANDDTYQDAWGTYTATDGALNDLGLEDFRIRSLELYPGLALDRYRIRAAYDAGFLQNHWSFELNASDSISTMTGTAIGTPDYSNMRAIDGEWSLQFDGSSGLDYGFNPLEPFVDASRRSYSWSLWVRPEGMEATKFRTLLQNTFVDSNAGALEFQQMELLQFGSELQFSVARAPDNDLNSSRLNENLMTAELQPDVWNHIVAVFDDDLNTPGQVSLQLYVNGVASGATQSSGVVDVGDHRESQPLNLLLGLPQYDRVRHYSGSGAMYGFEGLQGLMDDVRFYQHALDDDEVRNLYNFYRPEDDWR